MPLRAISAPPTSTDEKAELGAPAKKAYKPFMAAHHGSDVPTPSGVNSVGLAQDEAGQEQKKNKFGKYGNTVSCNTPNNIISTNLIYIRWLILLQAVLDSVQVRMPSTEVFGSDLFDVLIRCCDRWWTYSRHLLNYLDWKGHIICTYYIRSNSSMTCNTLLGFIPYCRELLTGRFNDTIRTVEPTCYRYEQLFTIRTSPEMCSSSNKLCLKFRGVAFCFPQCSTPCLVTSRGGEFIMISIHDKDLGLHVLDEGA